MSTERKILAFPSCLLAPILIGLVALAAAGTAAAAPCTGPGAPVNTETRCLTAVAIPGNPLTGFDISFVNPQRAEYYLADRSNKGVDVIDTSTNTFKKRIFDPAHPFAGVVFTGGVANNNLSGPDGVVSRGRCLYAGDGDSTLKIFNIDSGALLQIFNTGANPPTRVDEMAMSTDGQFLLAANNAADPPFATLFSVDEESCLVDTGDALKIEADPSVIPSGFGLSIEQPAWVELIHRFVVSVPVIKGNPAGPPDCNYGQLASLSPCSGAQLVIDPTNRVSPIENVVPLVHCGPNGATVGPHGNVMAGCNPGNQAGDNELTIVNSKTLNYVDVGKLSGADEVWYNRGSNRYYTGSNANPAALGGPVLGVVDGTTNFLVEKIPQSPASHSVAADSLRNEIYVPESAQPLGTVGAGICGSTSGCVAVYLAPSTGDD